VSVSLSNTSGRCLVFVLAHDTYCRALGECVCDVQPGRGGKLLARSLTLASGVTLDNLPEAVLTVPDIAAAIRRSELSIRRRKSIAGGSKPPNRTGKRKRGTQ
jgi:hypothetical protein